MHSETKSSTSPAAPLEPAFLAMLVCPVTRAPLRYDAQASELISDRARLAYPVRDGVPILLEGEARALDDPA